MAVFMGHIAGVSGGVSKECHFELCQGLVAFLNSHRHDFGTLFEL
jgi:hypothetical protein